MKEREIFNSQRLHHAYCVEGDRAAARKIVLEFLEGQLNIATRGNPDFWRASFETFGIDDARKLKEAQGNKAFAAAPPARAGGADTPLPTKKIFLIETNAITREAQNSLLKVFEEPTADTHFFIIIPSAENLLPTLRSRLVVVSVSGGKGNVAEKEAEQFLVLSPAKRLEIVKKLAQEIADEKRSKADAVTFLDTLETILHRKLRAGKNVSLPVAAALKEIELCRNYMTDRSASVKMLLEYAALILP
jgi:hypothetical protein